MNIYVKRNRSVLFQLDSDVFFLLFNHTIVHRDTKFNMALETATLRIEDFLRLCRKGEVPYPLFFLDRSTVKEIVADYEKKVYCGVSKNQISIATRDEVALADIDLIIRDIVRTQMYLHDILSGSNIISGIFKKTGKSVEDKVACIKEILGIDKKHVITLSKEKTFNYINELLAKLQVFTSLYVDSYTPQRINKSLKFSGIAINDRKCPFLFIKAGDIDSTVELWGRRIFTTILLLSALCHGDFGPVTLDSSSSNIADLSNRHYLFAEEFLMPRNDFEMEKITSRSDIDELGYKYSVSPSAVVMRAFRLKVISKSEKEAYMDNLRTEWKNIVSNRKGNNPIRFEKAINRYKNPVVVNLILSSYQQRGLTDNAVKNLLCYKKGERVSLTDLINYEK